VYDPLKLPGFHEPNPPGVACVRYCQLYWTLAWPTIELPCKVAAPDALADKYEHTKQRNETHKEPHRVFQITELIHLMFADLDATVCQWYCADVFGFGWLTLQTGKVASQAEFKWGASRNNDPQG